MKFVPIYHSNWKVKIRRAILHQFSSKVHFFMSKISIVARPRRCQLATTAPVLLFTCAIALCYELFSSKVQFFMSKIPIVARPRRCQLATTAPVLKPPGKPSTWFPGEKLVTQAPLYYLLLNIFFQNHFISSKSQIDNFK